MRRTSLKNEKPKGEAEAEAALAATIYRVVDLLASRFRFGYYSVEDMRQQGCVFALEAINKGYDASRPLENFLYTHLRNRFINLKRDKYVRNEPPCRTCIFYDPQLRKSENACAAFEDKSECKKLSDWKIRNAAKKSLMKPLDVSLSSDSLCRVYPNNFDFDELKRFIDEHLPADLRTDYLRLCEGLTLPKVRRQKVREAVLEIIHEKVT